MATRIQDSAVVFKDRLIKARFQRTGREPHNENVLDRAYRIYQFIVRFKLAHDGIAPSYREILDECDLKSISNIRPYLAWIESGGFIRLMNYDRGIAVVGGRWTFGESLNVRKIESTDDRAN